MAPSTVMPKNWKDFLRVNENKTELFAFLSHKAVHLSVAEGKEIYATDGSGVLCSPAGTPCPMFTRGGRHSSTSACGRCCILHVADAVQKGCKKVTIRTVDTDVVVLALGSFSKIAPDQLWVAFGVRMVSTRNPTQCLTLPVYTFTGCDTASAFAGRGKKTACVTWKSFPEETVAFNELLCMTSEVSEGSMLLLERFVVQMYDRTSESTEVNDARKHLFTQKFGSVANIPPTQAALKQHIKRTCYPGQLLEPGIGHGSRDARAIWGWTKETTGWQPLFLDHYP